MMKYIFYLPYMTPWFSLVKLISELIQIHVCKKKHSNERDLVQYE